VLAQLVALSPDYVDQAENCIICLSDDMEMNHAFNEVKFYTIQSLGLLYFYLMSKKPKAIYGNDNPFYMRISHLMVLFNFTCKTIGTSPRREILLKNNHIKTVIRKSIKMLSLFSSEINFSPFFTENGTKLVISVVLPYLIPSEEEKENCKLDPAEFVNLGIDAVFQQKSEIVKTTAAKVLETFCEKIDGLVSFTVSFLLEVLQRTLVQSGDPKAD